MIEDRELIEYEAGLRCCWNILAKLSEVDGIGEPDLEQGECSDCERSVHVRWSLKALELCRACRGQRYRVGVRLQAQGRSEAEDWVGEEPPLRLSA